MTVLHATYSRTPSERRIETSARVWGLSPEGLHDRFWSSRLVQVVRAGTGSVRVESSGPALYLLLDRAQLALFDLAPVLKRLNWLKPRIAWVRLVSVARSAYFERVEEDADHRLVGVQREYGSRTASTAQVFLTPEVKIAREWAAGAGGADARRALRRSCGREHVAAMSMRGKPFDFRSEREVDAMLRTLLADWKRPNGVIDGVYNFQPGVWLHESVEIDEGVRLIAPLWVGAGVTLMRGDLVLGPRALVDERECAVSTVINWREMRTAAWRLTTTRLTPRRLFGKRAFDMVFSLGVVLATAPLYPIIMLAIMLEDGWPVFFAHSRQTVRGRSFPCLKFRTMRRNAESMKAQLAGMNQADGPQFFMENDPRILKVGKVLRKFQLDELPQFINVLLGHMSVVGPRPSPDKENQCCPAWREARLSVRPGVTGLWQIRRTREPQTDFQEWIRYDLEYVQHRSWRLDFFIILQTIRKVLGG